MHLTLFTVVWVMMETFDLSFIHSRDVFPPDKNKMIRKPLNLVEMLPLKGHSFFSPLPV